MIVCCWVLFVSCVVVVSSFFPHDWKKKAPLTNEASTMKVKNFVFIHCKMSNGISEQGLIEISPSVLGNSVLIVLFIEFVFDFDGVLIDSSDAEKDIIINVLKNHGYQLGPKDFAEFSGIPWTELFSRLGKKFFWTPFMEKTVMEECLEISFKKIFNGFY